MHALLRPRPFARLLVAALLIAAVVATGLPDLPRAEAFKPFTHVETGEDARTDALDGEVEINGKKYPVRGEIVDALKKWPAHYNAGVIGPDGFPDLVMGQSIIHPENTGLWFRHIIDSAWAAQSDSRYSADEKGQILAFAYGYLTHGAGDMWMHTMVNEFALGVFPPVKEILTDVDMASIALRHLVVEGYVGDATRGFDGNPDRTNVGGDISDDSSPAIAYDAPLEFIQRTLVRRVDDSGNAVGPAPDRGALLDYFYGLKNTLQAEIDDDPQPLEAALSKFADTKAAFEDLGRPATCTPEDAQIDDDGDGAPDDGCGDDNDKPRVGRGEDESGPCSFGVGNTGIDVAVDVAYDLVACPAALLELGITAAVDSFEALTTLATETISLALDAVVDAYLEAWVEDIDAGLEAWPELGLAVTRAMFDPQTRRNTQNDECGHLGPDTTDPTTVRSKCEDKVGGVDVVFHEADPFINDHLLSMLGLPDVVGDLRALLQEAADALDDIVGPALNPLRKVTNAIKNEAKELVKDELDRRFGIDVDEIQDFLASPSSKMDVDKIEMDLPIAGHVEVPVFQADDHEKLDAYLGIIGPHHKDKTLGGGLEDDITFDKETFAAYRNTVVMSKLLLLDGSALDDVLSDLVGHEYRFYGDIPGSNIMLTPLPGAGSTPASASQWLKMIDGDHAWRSDGAPVFEGAPSGGEGNFPLWESCVLRDRGFRGLFQDWENGAENFPALGDEVSPDPNDPQPPTSTVTAGTPSVADSGFTWVSGATSLTVGATDGFWDPDELDVRYRVVDNSGEERVAWTSATVGATLTLGGLPDGHYTVETEASDPCGTETIHGTQFAVDNTPPQITIASPVDGATHDTDDLVPTTFGAEDEGVGVATTTATFDGAPTVAGATIDTFWLDAGLHQVTVTAADKLGNTATSTSVFRVRATAASLLNNIDRAWSQEQLITNAAAYKGLRDSAVAAVKSHDKGKHDTEWNQLGAIVNQLTGQLGKGVDATFATRAIGWVNDLVLAGG
jgi:hypothetical protein